MPRLQPLSPDTTPELKSHFDFFLGTLGFTPNSVLTMQRRPRLVQAFAQLNAAVMDPAGEVDLGLRRLIGHLASHGEDPGEVGAAIRRRRRAHRHEDDLPRFQRPSHERYPVEQRQGVRDAGLFG